MDGAGEGNRTPNRLITNQVLYQLSYAGAVRDSSLHFHVANGARQRS